MKEQIKIVVKRVGQKPTVETVTNELETLQEIVGGYIEIPYSSELPEGINLVCNEEGKLLDFEPNIYWGDSDIICGDCFFMAHDEDGDATDLTDEQVEKALNFAQENAVSFEENDSQVVIISIGKKSKEMEM